MTALRFAYKVAIFGTYAWLGWKLAAIENKVRDLAEQSTVHDDLLTDAYVQAIDSEMALAWEGR